MQDQLDTVERKLDVFAASTLEHFARIDGRLDGVEGRLDRVESRLDGVESRLDGVEGRLSSVEGLLREILDRLPPRLH